MDGSATINLWLMTYSFLGNILDQSIMVRIWNLISKIMREKAKHRQGNREEGRREWAMLIYAYGPNRLYDILRHRCELKSNFAMAGKFSPFAFTGRPPLFTLIAEFNLTKIDDLIGKSVSAVLQSKIWRQDTLAADNALWAHNHFLANRLTNSTFSIHRIESVILL